MKLAHSVAATERPPSRPSRRSFAHLGFAMSRRRLLRATTRRPSALLGDYPLPRGECCSEKENGALGAAAPAPPDVRPPPTHWRWMWSLMPSVVIEMPGRDRIPLGQVGWHGGGLCRGDLGCFDQAGCRRHLGGSQIGEGVSQRPCCSRQRPLHIQRVRTLWGGSSQHRLGAEVRLSLASGNREFRTRPELRVPILQWNYERPAHRARGRFPKHRC